MPIVGSRVRVEVDSPDKKERALVAKVRSMAIGREIIAVSLIHGQLLLSLSDGGKLAINVEGGLREVS